MYREKPELEEYLVIWGTKWHVRKLIINRFVGIDAKAKAHKWIKEEVKPTYPENYRVVSLDDWIMEGNQ